MKKQIVVGAISEKRMLNMEEVCAYIGMGQTRARQYMDEIGAVRKFGRRVLFDKLAIDKALNEMNEQ